MNCDRKFDAQIKAVLHAKADALEVSAASQAALEGRIEQLQQMQIKKTKAKERFTMKHFSKKVLVAFCTIFCLTCATAVASNTGLIRGWVCVSSPLTEVQEFEQVSGLLDMLEFYPKYVEEFSNGFIFASANTTKSQALDDNNEKTGKVYTELVIDYLNADDVRMTLFVEDTPINGEGLPANAVIKQVGDVELIYNQQHYKFVPVGYEMTEEDKAAVADGSLMISEGTKEIEKQTANFVSWVEDNVKYAMLIWDSPLTAEEMLDMAAEIVNSAYQDDEAAAINANLPTVDSFYDEAENANFYSLELSDNKAVDVEG